MNMKLSMSDEDETSSAHNDLNYIRSLEKFLRNSSGRSSVSRYTVLFKGDGSGLKPTEVDYVRDLRSKDKIRWKCRAVVDDASPHSKIEIFSESSDEAIIIDNTSSHHIGHYDELMGAMNSVSGGASYGEFAVEDRMFGGVMVSGVGSFRIEPRKSAEKIVSIINGG